MTEFERATLEAVARLLERNYPAAALAELQDLLTAADRGIRLPGKGNILRVALAELKASFPEQEFTLSNVPGGDLRVDWEYGPTVEAVKAVLNPEVEP